MLVDSPVATAIGTLLTGAMAAWFGAYMALMGKNFATRQDWEFIRKNTEDTQNILKTVDLNFSRQFAEWQQELNYRQEQLSSLYGPVWAILGSQIQIFDLWTKGNMTDKNFDVKKYFVDQNDTICELITTHAHLIEGRAFPRSFTNFFTTALIFKLYAGSSEVGEIPAHLTRKALDMPFGEFSADIQAVTDALKARLDDLHLKYAKPLLASAAKASP
jgi:hypothetical protein